VGSVLVLMKHLAKLLVALYAEDLVELRLVCAELLLARLVQLLTQTEAACVTNT